MRIMGIDPGIERTGFAILEKNGSKIGLVDCGLIRTSKEDPLPRRLRLLAQDLESLLTQWKPSAAGLEQVFFSKNVKTAMKISSARGVIMEVLEERGVTLRELNPSHIKISVAGHGRATKQEVQKMLRVLLGVRIKSDDTADAIAAGLCLLTTSFQT